MTALEQLTPAAKAVLRGSLIGGALAASDQDGHGALSEIRLRKIGPVWVQGWVVDHRDEALDLAAKTAAWLRTIGRTAAPEGEARRFWNDRCKAEVPVHEVAAVARVSCKWIHDVEEGAVTASRAHLLLLRAALTALTDFEPLEVAGA